MENEKGMKIVERYKNLKAHRGNWEDHWQSVSEYFDVNRASITVKRAAGERRHRHLYDSTGLKSSAELAATIHSIVTNPASKWFTMEFVKGYKPTDEEKEWMDDATDRMFAAINESNFNIEVTSAYRDYANLGSADLVMEPEPYVNGEFNGVRYRAAFIDEVCFELDATNRLTTVYREHNLTIEQAKMKWPDIEERFTDDMKRIGNQDGITAGVKGDPKIQFLECIKFRKVNNYNPAESTNAEKRPYSYELLVCKTGEILKTGGRYRLGHYFFTWNRAPGEVYGRGPGFEALPFMRTLNEVVRMDLEATAKRINPPMKTRYNNLIGDVNLRPAGLTVCRDPMGIMPFETGASIQESKLRIEDMQNQVRSIFLLDKLALPPRDQVGEMTAYEIQRRVQEMNQILGPILARLNDELLQPMIEDLFYVMLRSNGFAQMPESMKEGGAEIKVKFVNPLSRAQKAEEMAAVQLWLQDLMMLANAGKPEVLDFIDDENLAPGSAETRGVPARYVADVEAVKQKRQQREEMMQQQQQAEINAKNADAQYKMQQGADQGGRPTEQ